MRPVQQVEVYPDGLVDIWTTKNRYLIAKAGAFRYEKLSVGVNRYYQASISNSQIDMLIKVPSVKTIKREMIAVVDGVQYWIHRVQEKPERGVYFLELKSQQPPMKEAT
jgi:hypothetical protein